VRKLRAFFARLGGLAPSRRRERDLAEATKLGTIQISMLSGPFSNFCKEVQVLDIPYLFSSYLVAWKVLDGPFGKELAQECLNKSGIRGLTYGQVGFRNFTNSTRPIKTPRHTWLMEAIYEKWKKETGRQGR